VGCCAGPGLNCALVVASHDVKAVDQHPGPAGRRVGVSSDEMVSKALGLLWDGVAEQVDAETVGNGLSHELSSQGPSSAQTLRRATARLARLDTERLKLVQMAYADAIPIDLLKREQARISAEREQTERELAQTERHGPAIERVYRHAADLMRRAAAIYALADDDNRRAAQPRIRCSHHRPR